MLEKVVNSVVIGHRGFFFLLSILPIKQKAKLLAELFISMYSNNKTIITLSFSVPSICVYIERPHNEQKYRHVKELRIVQINA